MHRLACFVFSLVFCHSLVAEDFRPLTPPPQFGEAELLADGQLKIWLETPVPIPETRTREVVIDGKRQTQEYTVFKWIPNVQEKLLSADRYVVLTVAGERLDQAAVRDRFGTKRPSLIVPHGKRLDASYSNFFESTSPVIYIRPNVQWTSMGPQDLDQQGPVVFGGGPSQPHKEAAVIPVPVTISAANGKVVVRSFSWMQYPMWKNVELTKQVKSDEGIRTVKMTDSVAEGFWAPTEQIEEFAVQQCQVIGPDGQSQGNAALTSLPQPAKAFWLQDGTQFDVRTAAFLKPGLLIVKTPPGQMAANMMNSLSCAPILDFAMASIQGDNIQISRPIFEHQSQKVPYTIQVDGKEVTKYREVMRSVSKPVTSSQPIGQFDAVDGTGKAIPDDQLRERLSHPTSVLVCDFPFISPKQFPLLNQAAIVLKPKAVHRPGGPNFVPSPNDSAPPLPAPSAPRPVPTESPPPPSASAPPQA